MPIPLTQASKLPGNFKQEMQAHVCSDPDCAFQYTSRPVCSRARALERAPIFEGAIAMQHQCRGVVSRV
ncbi:hypothetical protein PZA11_000913 [Diplocarpon coronariae]